MNEECVVKCYDFRLDRDGNIDRFLANGGLSNRARSRDEVLDAIGHTLDAISTSLGSRRRAQAVTNMPPPLNTSQEIHQAVLSEMQANPGLGYRDALARVMAKRTKSHTQETKMTHHTTRPGDEIHHLVVREMDADASLSYSAAFQLVMTPERRAQYNTDAIKPKVTTMTYKNFQADEAGAAIDAEARLLMQQNPKLRYAQAVKTVIRQNPQLARDYGEAALARESKNG